MFVRVFAVSLFAAFLTAGCAAQDHQHPEYASKADIAEANAAATRADAAAKRAEVAAEKAEVIFHKSLQK
jgi:hypothetical protein